MAECDPRTLFNSTGSPHKQTGVNGIENCVNELNIIGPNKGTRFICIALLAGRNGDKFYNSCQLGQGKCPLDGPQGANVQTLPPLTINGRVVNY